MSNPEYIYIFVIILKEIGNGFFKYVRIRVMYLLINFHLIFAQDVCL